MAVSAYNPFRPGNILEIEVRGSDKTYPDGRKCRYYNRTYIGSLMDLPGLDQRVYALSLLRVHEVENGSGKDPLFAKTFPPKWDSQQGKWVIPDPEPLPHHDPNKGPLAQIKLLGFEAGEYLIPRELVTSMKLLGKNLQAWKSSDPERIEYLEQSWRVNDRDQNLQADLRAERFPFKEDPSMDGNTQESDDTVEIDITGVGTSSTPTEPDIEIQID